MKSTPPSSGLRSQTSSLIGWFASNPVAANLLMLLILAGGLVGYLDVDKEVFPRLSPRQIVVGAYYPGAGPLEIEESVCVPIEEAIYDLPGVRRLNSEITEAQCTIKVGILPEYDRDQLINTLRGKIQAIPRLPKNMEKVEVTPGVRDDDDGVIWVALHGANDPLALARFGDRIQAELARIPGVNGARNYNKVPYEITIEVAAAKLRQYQLSLHQIAEAVRRASLDMPAGLVKTPAGELLLRVKGKAADAAAIGGLVLRTNPDGSRVLLGDIATIKDGLEERVTDWHHNGETAQGWEIHADHDTVEVARKVKAYVAAKQADLPEGLVLKTWWDDSEAYEERVRTLLEDGISGFALVCVVLTLFLQLRVAIWAGAGILTSVAGALWLMPVCGVSLNMLSLFGFLLAMGILVDDAIIIGESVHSRQEEAVGLRLEAEQAVGNDEPTSSMAPDASSLQPTVSSLKPNHPASSLMPQVSSLQAAILGTQAVALSVFLSVSVALVAFLPGLFLPGWSGQMMRPICVVMILTMLFSLVEALLILPAHLAHATRLKSKLSRLERLRNWLNGGLDRFVERCYRPLLRRALSWRYLVVAGFAVLILLSVALVVSGRVRQSLNPDVTKDSFWVLLTVPEDAPYSEARRLSAKVEQALFELRDEIEAGGLRPEALGRRPAVDLKPTDSSLNPAASFLQPKASSLKPQNLIVGVETIVWEHGAGLWVEFSAAGREKISVEHFIRDWRTRIGDLGRAKIDFIFKEGDQPYDIEFFISAADPAGLPAAAEAVKTKLASYAGVYDVVDSFERGKPELRLKLKPEAERMNLRLEDLAEQVRHGYFGEEVHRLQRGGSEVKVMVRHPRDERQSLDSLRALPVQLPDGVQAPLSALAEVNLVPGLAKLHRQDRQRIVKIMARVDTQKADVNAIYTAMETDAFKTLHRQFPGLSINIGQERQEEEAMTTALGRNTAIALLVIYALIAVPFRSYLKPVIFLLAAPVAWSGAVLAHWLAGLPLSMESLVGMIAASGVVVNDSLVLLDYMRENEGVGSRPKAGGKSPEADGTFSSNLQPPASSLIQEACASRFRPILLAFLTNFAGFLPTLLETSAQAQFLIPMTLSLSAGLLVGMAASLILTPVCYAILGGAKE